MMVNIYTGTIYIYIHVNVDDVHITRRLIGIILIHFAVIYKTNSNDLHVIKLCSQYILHLEISKYM
jgi:hypothetical protein